MWKEKCDFHVRRDRHKTSLCYAFFSRASHDHKRQILFIYTEVRERIFSTDTLFTDDEGAKKKGEKKLKVYNINHDVYVNFLWRCKMIFI